MVTESFVGGLRKHIVDLLLGLDQSAYEITFVYSRHRVDAIGRSQLADLASRGIRLVEIPMSRGPAVVADLRGLIALAKVVQATRPDIIHCHAAKAGALGRIAARLRHVRHVVYTPHGGAFHKLTGARGLAYLAVERLLNTPSVHFIGVSAASCRAIKQYVAPREENVHLVYNGIDLRAIDRQRQECAVARRDVGVPEDRFVVLYPALFFEAKGHLQLLDAMDRSETRLGPRVLILLAGDGPLAGKVQRKISALGLDGSFQFIGFQPELAKFYNICDVVLLPSQSEAFPYVPLEAMAFAKPVIATAVGGVPELVSHGYTGELVAPDRLGEIVTRLNYYSQHPDEAARLGRSGRTAVERGFAVESMVANTSRLYQEVLGCADG